MAVNSQFGQDYAIAVDKYVTAGKFIDNIFSGQTALAAMKKFNGYQKIDGGVSVAVQIEYAMNPTAGFRGAYSEIPIQQTEEFDIAQYNWRFLSDSIAVSFAEMGKWAGDSARANGVQGKLRNAEASLREQLETTLFAASPAGDDINSFQQFITNTGSVGGIDATTTNTWWRANVYTTVGALTIQNMDSVFNQCWQNISEPDFIVTTRALYEKYSALARSNYQFLDRKMVDMGFGDIQFRGKPVIFSTACPSGHVYFVNTQDGFGSLKLYVHRDFDFHVTPENEMDKQLVLARKVFWMGNLGVGGRRFQGRMTGQLETA